MQWETNNTSHQPCKAILKCDVSDQKAIQPYKDEHRHIRTQKKQDGNTAHMLYDRDR